MLFALGVAGQTAAGQVPGGSETAEYVRVLDRKGKPALGLSAADFTAALDGKPVEIRQARPLDRSGGDGSAAGLRFVICLDADLTVREAFRTRRALLDLVPRIDLGRDSAAVYSNRALSGFTQDPKRLRGLIDYFGEEIDRMGFGRAAPAESRWKMSWPVTPPTAAEAEASLEELAARGNQGRLNSVLTALRNLEGWKILLYFGRDIPYRSDELEYHDPRFAARALSDAGFTVFAFNPSGREDSGMRRLRQWAEGTGGSAWTVSGDLRPALRKWPENLTHAYRLTLLEPFPRDCRWSDLKIDVARPGLRVFHGAGFFATRDAPVDLEQRTLWTVAAAPERFQDLPLEVKADIETTPVTPERPPRPSAVRVTVRFPFAATRDHDTETQNSRSGEFQQRIYFFIGVYDRHGKLLGRFEDPLLLGRDRVSLEGSAAELARLDETILLDRFETPASLQTIVVIGQNRRIATRSLVFGTDEFPGR